MTSHHTSTTLDAELLDRYLAGQCTPPEAEAVARWLEAVPARAAMIDVLHRELSGGIDRDTPMHVSGDWRQPMKRTVRSTGVAIPRSWRNVATGIASVCVIVFGWMFVRHIPSTQSSHTAGTAARVYQTTLGQRATVRLTDGSRVTLAPHTRLVVPSDFGSTTRAVSVSGEAYFDVPANAKLPFIVHAGNVQANVLGTTFTVRRYTRDLETWVAVVTGRVSVGTLARSGRAGRAPHVVLSAGMIGHVTDSTTNVVTRTSMGEYTDWTKDQLVFNRTPIPQALATIERWYGYQFRVADTVLMQQDLTATFDARNVADMLLTLRTLLDVTMTFDGPVVTLKPRRTSHGSTRLRLRDPSIHSSRTEVGR